jgi:Uma2 family endonuclease
MATTTTVKLTEPQARRWTREEYYRLAEEGWFQGQRVMLLNGDIIQMPPQGYTHRKAILLTVDILRKIFGTTDHVCSQMPLNASLDSDPEPDVAVIKGSVKESTAHPETALLVVEVADSSLRIDRRKASLYAAAGVPEYWIVNLGDLRLEVFRNPAKEPGAEWGWSYGAPKELTLSESISPLARPDAIVRVAELFE